MDVVGIAPRAKIVTAVAMMPEADVDPWTSEGDLESVIRGIRYVVDQGARIVNLSFGNRVTAEQLAQIDKLPLWDELEEKGVILICAAGNDHSDNDRDPVFPASLGRSNIISVMATDAEGRLGRLCDSQTGQWQTFSNYGKASVHLAAPGTLIIGAGKPGEATLLCGTSYSAAVATGVVALVWGQNPDWNYRQVVAKVLGSVRKYPPLVGTCRSCGLPRLPDALR